MTKIDNFQLSSDGLYCYDLVLSKIATQINYSPELNEFTKEMLSNLEPFNEDCSGLAEVVFDAFSSYLEMKDSDTNIYKITAVEGENFTFNNMHFFLPDDHLVLNAIKNHLNKLKLQYF
ncbi:MAG: hypothetical protein K9G11_00695, partial [Rickettsiaceae bacterium]|nr:hypothetical protein [Rickettsiaceae bacterium]